MAQPQDESSYGLTRLPLFPLNLVLFPGMDLPLHIFEERYRDMIGECLENDAPFGVVLIKNGPEVGARADPERIGTSTRILRSEILDQGRMNIMTRGQQRFEIEEIVQRVPHVVGPDRSELALSVHARSSPGWECGSCTKAERKS